ncbi:MAG: class I SAM-dependent methyltransferase [Fibrobacter sp.]|nr:class I SAM-dependent methyltransferase [Fibrobacter sp.]
MDPACGPATWLALFSEKGVRVAGNDICSEMIDIAVEKCGDTALELIVGDMCDLQFKKGPFEVTFELAGTCGLLGCESKFTEFLKSILEHTCSGGMILLTVFFHELELYNNFPWVVGEWGPFDVAPQGKAWLRYEVLKSDAARSIDRVRRTVRTLDVSQCSDSLVDEYDMYSWKEDAFWKMIAKIPELEYVTSFRYDEPSGIVFTTKGELSGETTVIFTRN